MGLFNNWQLLIIRLLCCLGWFSTFAFAQYDISEGVSGTLNFATLGVTCLGNLSVFVTALIRGRLDVEIGARDVLDILSSPKLNKINGIQNGKGLTTCTEEEATQTAPTEEGTTQAASTEGLHREVEAIEINSTEEEARQTAPTEGLHKEEEEEKGLHKEGLHKEEEEEGLHKELSEDIATQTASTEGGLHTEEEATQTASTEGGLHTEEEATQTASTEGGLHTEEEATQTASTEGGLHTEEEATETASTEGGLHTEEEATQTASTGGGCLHYFRQNVFGQFFHKEEGQQTTSTERKGLKTASVVMLSYGKPNLSITDFMRYNDPFVEFILLQYLPVVVAINDTNVTAELTRKDLPVADAINNANVRAEHTPEVILERCQSEHSCNCIVFWTVEEITSMLARRMPGTLKQLSEFLCLLPCLTCLTNCCHGCNQEELLHVEQPDEESRLRERDSKVECEILDEVNAGCPGKPICICIPMNDARCDNWTELLERSLRSKDAESGGVRDKASEAIKGYLAMKGGRGGAKEESVEYNILSYILPRLTEIFINGLLTICFRVDGFSSSLIARRTVRNFLVDSKGSSLAANAFLTKAVVKCGANNTRICQVLTFRENHLCIRCLSFIVGCVNLFSIIGWAMLISSMPWSSRRPSRHGVVVIIVAILVALFMDVFCFTDSSHRRLISALFMALVLIIALALSISSTLFIFLVAMMALFLLVLIHPSLSRWVLNDPGLNLFIPLFPMVLCLETFAIAILIVSIESGEKYIGRWIYGALQALVWLKWAAGSYILNFEKSQEFLGESPHTWGILVHSSAFMLNAVLAGVRGQWKLWKLWPWKHHPSVPRKLGP